MTSSAERHLLADFNGGTERLKREIGYNPSYFTRMVSELGPAEAARQLIRKPTPSDGFSKLWEHGVLEFAVEAFALLPWYSDLFADGDRRRARRRLEDHGFDVDDFVRRRMLKPPEWWSGAFGTDAAQP